MKHKKLVIRIKYVLILFFIFLVLSNITAFRLEQELGILLRMKGYFSDRAVVFMHSMAQIILNTNNKYPFLCNGIVCLTFVLINIAVAFIEPLRDSIYNKWVIKLGMITCGMIFLLAFINGGISQIAYYSQLLECSFEVIGLMPLFLCYPRISQPELLTLNK
ncbi:MAG TPA: hypothetical protein PK323_11465 [Bacteroidia bacterium]|nr:hypothetical protein [Bacteroidia bacterium]